MDSELLEPIRVRQRRDRRRVVAIPDPPDRESVLREILEVLELLIKSKQAEWERNRWIGYEGFVGE